MIAYTSIFMDALDAARAMTGECLCFRSRRAARVITRAYDEALRPVGLHATQLTLLNAVASGGEEGQLMPRLCAGLAMDPTTLSRNLRPLEREGLVEISRLAGDRRVRVARLTETGRARLLAAFPLWRQAHERVQAALGEPHAKELRLKLDFAATAMARAD